MFAYSTRPTLVLVYLSPSTDILGSGVVIAHSMHT